MKSKVRLGKKTDGAQDHVASWCGNFAHKKCKRGMAT